MFYEIDEMEKTEKPKTKNQTQTENLNLSNELLTKYNKLKKINFHRKKVVFYQYLFIFGFLLIFLGASFNVKAITSNNCLMPVKINENETILKPSSKHIYFYLQLTNNTNPNINPNTNPNPNTNINPNTNPNTNPNIKITTKDKINNYYLTDILRINLLKSTLNFSIGDLFLFSGSLIIIFSAIKVIYYNNKIRKIKTKKFKNGRYEEIQQAKLRFK